MIHPSLNLPREAVADLCRKYHVRELALFGSVLREDFRPDSDVDFLVEFQPDYSASWNVYAGLQEALEDLVSRRVDLVPKNGLKPLIRKSVLESRSVLYAT